jgi:hypothetical protein
LPHADLGYSLNVTPEQVLPQLAAGSRTATGSRGSCSPSRPSELDIRVDLTADMTVINPFDFFVEEYAESRRSRMRRRSRRS